MLLTQSIRRFFPSTEPLEAEVTDGAEGKNREEEWEEVTEGVSAENGAPEIQADNEAVSQMDIDTAEAPKIE